MWLSKHHLTRRAALLGLGATSLAACNFTPVYGTGSAASKLQNRVRIKEPTSSETFLITRHLESKIGRGDPAPMFLSVRVTHSASSLGKTATGSSTRRQRRGRLRYTLSNVETGEAITNGSIQRLVGYSTRGNTAASLANERDSIERLMIFLADELLDRLLLLDADELP